MAETSMFSLWVLLTFFSFIIVLVRKLSRRQSLPPGPKALPIIGNILDISGKVMPHVALARLAEAYGPFISLRLGAQLIVVASSPAAAAEVLKTHDRLLSGRNVPDVHIAKASNHLSVAWTVECTERWRLLRTVCRSELFAPKMIEAQSRLRAEKALQLVEFIQSKEGQPLGIAALAFHSVFNFLGNVFFSKELTGFGEEGKTQEVGGILRQLMELSVAPNISDFYPLLAPLDLQGLRSKTHKVARKLFIIWEGTVKERREKRNKLVSEERHRDFLDVLLESGFSDEQIDILLLDLIVAGTDTTTSTIEWTLAELLRNREALIKVRQELEHEISGSLVTEAHLANLPYLQACVKESLRLHPAAPLLLHRRAAQDCKIMNYTIPKDTRVHVNVWAIGRDPTIWDDPLSFRPERFLDSDLDYKGNDFEFLPFGGGRRICPGLPMASRQVEFTLATLIHHFEWSLPNNHQLQMEEKFGVTLQKKQPLVLIPKHIR